VRRRVLYNIGKKGISRACASRGRDAWDPLIDIKSYRKTPPAILYNLHEKSGAKSKY
jgi:hypothetical protein